nr:hypothetical protein [uncultured bacterium]
MSTSEPPYRFEDANGYSVIVIQPRLNDSQWSEFESVGNALLGHLNQAKSPACLVDLSALNYMGSAMVALIVRMWKGVKERNGRMVVINSHPMVFEVMKLAGLHNVWTIVESREQGLKSLGKRSESSGDNSSAALIGLGALGVVAGLVGLAMLFDFLPFNLSKQIEMACTFGGAAVGLFAGTICAAKGTGTKQKAGIFFAAASAAIMIVGIIKMPGGQSGPTGANQAEPPATVGGADSTTVAAPATGGPSANKGRRKNKDDEPKADTAAAEQPVPAASEAPAETETPAADAPKEGAEPTPAADNASPEAEAAKTDEPAIKLPAVKGGFKKGDNK